VTIAGDGTIPEGLVVPPDDTESHMRAREQEMREEVESHSLVGPQTSLDTLKEQYAANADFLRKVVSLESKFSKMRRTRPDGNCFYRAYLFGIFEQLAGSSGSLTGFQARARKSLEYCVEAGYEKVAIEDFFEEFICCLERVTVEGANASTVEATFEECDDYIICWSRILTSTYLKRHQDEYSAFLTSHASIADFCSKEVDPMKTEADNLQIIALSSFFAVPVCVLYLDRSEGDMAVEHRFESPEAAGVPPVYLLYRPGHYDLIYPC